MGVCRKAGRKNAELDQQNQVTSSNIDSIGLIQDELFLNTETTMDALTVTNYLLGLLLVICSALLFAVLVTRVDFLWKFERRSSDITESLRQVSDGLREISKNQSGKTSTGSIERQLSHIATQFELLLKMIEAKDFSPLEMTASDNIQNGLRLRRYIRAREAYYRSTYENSADRFIKHLHEEYKRFL